MPKTPLITNTPKPPYYAVIFTSEKKLGDAGFYDETSSQLIDLASEQEGFLGFESVRQDIGITVSYWSDIAAIKHWKLNADHQTAQDMGKAHWYSHYKVRIAKIERDYGTL